MLAALNRTTCSLVLLSLSNTVFPAITGTGKSQHKRILGLKVAGVFKIVVGMCYGYSKQVLCHAGWMVKESSIPTKKA